MTRNFGLGSGNIGKAGEFALNEAAREGNISFSTAATNGERWNIFSNWAKEKDVNKMEKITKELVKTYGKELAEKVINGEMASSTAQNYVSAINSVMNIATQNKWESVSPTKDCNIAQRSHVRDDMPGGLDREACSRAIQAVQEQVGERAAAVVMLARGLGLRTKEASLLNSRAALAEALKRGSVTITKGTKGGREREVLITSLAQFKALKIASDAQGGDRSMIPADQSWREWREGTLRDARDAVKEHTGGGLHDLRAAYACERYEAMTGHAAPCAGGEIADRDRDAAARLVVAEELGHGRIDVVAEYLGRRS